MTQPPDDFTQGPPTMPELTLPTDEPSKVPLIIGLVVTLIAAGGLAFYFTRGDDKSPDTTPSTNSGPMVPGSTGAPQDGGAGTGTGGFGGNGTGSGTNGGTGTVTDNPSTGTSPAAPPSVPTNPSTPSAPVNPNATGPMPNQIDPCTMVSRQEIQDPFIGRAQILDEFNGYADGGSKRCSRTINWGAAGARPIVVFITRAAPETVQAFRSGIGGEPPYNDEFIRGFPAKKLPYKIEVLIDNMFTIGVYTSDPDPNDGNFQDGRPFLVPIAESILSHVRP